jgi:hypothetical protein
MQEVTLSFQLELLEQLLLPQNSQKLRLFYLEGVGSNRFDEFIVLVLFHQLGLEYLEDRHRHFEEGIVTLAKPKVPYFAE